MSVPYEEVAVSIADSWAQQSREACETLLRRISAETDHQRFGVAGARALTMFVASLTHDLVVELDRLPTGVADSVRGPVNRAAAEEFGSMIGVLCSQILGGSTDEPRRLTSDLIELSRTHIAEQVRELLMSSSTSVAS